MQVVLFYKRVLVLRLGVCRKTGPWVVALNAGGENKNENHGTIFLALDFSFFFFFFPPDPHKRISFYCRALFLCRVVFVYFFLLSFSGSSVHDHFSVR